MRPLVIAPQHLGVAAARLVAALLGFRLEHVGNQQGFPRPLHIPSIGQQNGVGPVPVPES